MNMKKVIKFIPIVFCLLLSLGSCDVVRQVVRDTAVGCSAAIIHESAVKGGMDSDEAKLMVGDVFENIGLDRQSADIGMSWRDGLNKYDKQNIIGDYVMDAVGKVSGAPEVMEQMKRIKTEQLNYLSGRKNLTDRAKKMNTTVSEQDLQEVLNRRNLALFNVGYDAYQYAKERRAKAVAEKLALRDQLLEQGYDDIQLAEEVAGTIIAIQEAKDLSEEEKASYLRKLGFNNIKEVEIAVSESLVVSQQPLNLESEQVGQEETVKRLKSEQVGQEKAVKRLKSIVIDGFIFNRVFYTREQKLKLDMVADILNQYVGLKVCLVGHTCEIGGKEINRKVGLQRAEVGKEYLIKKGIASERILTDSKGDTQPLLPNSSDRNRDRNRRVEIVVID